MAPAGQGLTWSDVLCCIVCNQLFDHHRAPVNLTCGHVVCVRCIANLYGNACPEDQCEGKYPVTSYPINAALLSIVTDDIEEYLPSWDVEKVPKEVLSLVENALVSMAQYLHRAESERGGTVFSEVLSRTMQRKLVSLLCYQIVEEEGRLRALKTSRLIAERIMTELLLIQQNSGSLSTHLWTAVRARGCQFLGPAMQEDVLKLILLALDKGALIARKTLVMYVVQMLSEDYPQVSKTCVGHVVQLLYRASCFNVMKRDGESSLMQLKDEFRNYEALRKEHDAQIVQMAVECGLRISPDQWSALLYGDQAHRSHMQSIIDRLQTPNSYMQGIDELTAVVNGGDSTSGSCDLAQMAQLLRVFDSLPAHHERINWHRFADYIDALQKLVKAHVDFTMKRNEQRAREAQRSAAVLRSTHAGGSDKAHAYKTKMCKDISARRLCPRGARCTYAHSVEELRDAPRKDAGIGSCSQAGKNASFLPQRMMVAVAPPYNNNTINGAYQNDSSFTTVPPPPAAPAHPAHPAMVPILPVPVVMPSPTRHIPPPSTTHGSPPLVVLPTGIPRRGMVLNNTAATHHPQSPNGIHSVPPSHHSLWNTHPPPAGTMFVPHLSNTNNHPQTQFWMHPPPAVYTFDPPSENGFIWSSAQRPEMTIPPPPLPSARATDQLVDTEQLMMKRNEIINRLAPLTLLDEDDFEDGGVGHVSYTVASSVLDERGELHPVALVMGPPALELPPLPAANLSTVPLPTTASEGTIAVIGDIALATGSRPRASSIPLVQFTSVVTACPTTLFSTESTPSATVQADCTTMQLKDTLNQPLPTPTIQRSQVVAPMHMCAVPVTFDAGVAGERIGTVIRPVTIAHPQDMVSNSLDKIVDVKERLNEAEGASSTAVNQQLLVELRIAEREMDLLDPRTQASCLLRELRQVDKQIEQIEAARPIENC
uniref:RING-type E3 ubiquitin transferase n=1 Tax=Haemonchus contortus TaxID=6289 RepID=A0A7I4Y9N7_HAECO